MRILPDGNGYGNGYSYGNGYGDSFGYGYGSGYSDGDGDGYGNGNGYAHKDSIGTIDVFGPGYGFKFYPYALILLGYFGE